MRIEEKEPAASAESRTDHLGMGPAEAARSQARQYLVSQFHLDSAFVPVQKLSRVLGLSPSTIYGYMRQGKFFLPYRMFNTSPVVSLDDLVDWYVAGETVAACPPAEGAGIAAAGGASEPPRREPARLDVDSYVREKLVALGLSPSLRKRSRRPA